MMMDHLRVMMDHLRGDVLRVLTSLSNKDFKNIFSSYILLHLNGAVALMTSTDIALLI